MQNTMLRKQSNICSSDSKSSGGTSGVTFDGTKHGIKSNDTDSKGSEFSVSNSFLSDRRTPVYNHSLSFPLRDVTHTGNSLNLFENTSSTDFLCDDLPEIGSFEDVDRMFRQSDSTFGLLDSKEDEVGWLSSEYDKGKSGEALQSDFGFPCHETSVRANVSENYGSSESYTELTDAPIWIKDAREKYDSYASFANGLGIGNGRHGFIPEEQMNECKNQLKQLKHMEEKRKELNFGNGINSYLGNLPYELNQLSSGTTSLQGYPSMHMSQQLRATGPDSFFYQQNNGSQPYSDNSQLSDQAYVTFANSTTLVPWASSYPSNQMQCMGNSHDPQSLLTAISGTRNGADLHTFQSDTSSQTASLMEQASVQDPVYSTSVVIGILLIPCSCTSLINMETGTNPVDRSIAQLLFQRPSNSSVIFAHDG